jgi:hypothetical protein
MSKSESEPDNARLGLDELPKAKHAYRYVLDNRWLRQIERWERTAPKLTHPVGVPTWVREMKHHLDPDDWNTGFLKVRDYDPPMQLLTDLHAVAPQALLRDLFRPVMELRWYERELLVRLDYGGQEAVREGRSWLKRDPLPTVEPMTRVVAETQAWQRTLRRVPWQPHYPDSEERKKVEVYRSPDVLNY